MQKIMVKKTGKGEIMSAWRFTENDDGVIVEILDPRDLDYAGVVTVLERDAVIRKTTIEQELKDWDAFLMGLTEYAL